MPALILASGRSVRSDADIIPLNHVVVAAVQRYAALLRKLTDRQSTHSAAAGFDDQTISSAVGHRCHQFNERCARISWLSGGVDNHADP